MIDILYEVQKFRPVDISAIPSDDKYGENVRLAFALYNKAIQKINNGYEDLARIDLKKAIQLYPNFYVAIILLGMCTFSYGDRIGAVRIFNSVKDHELREKSLNYLDYLATEMDKPGNRDAVHKDIREDEFFVVKIHGGEVNFDKFEVIEVEDTEAEVTIKKIEPVINEANRVEKIVQAEPAAQKEEVIIKEQRREIEKGREIIKAKEQEEVKVAEIVKASVSPVKEKITADKKYILAGYVFSVVIIVVLAVFLIKSGIENRDLNDTLASYKEGNNDATATPAMTGTDTPVITPSATPVDYYALTAEQVKECKRQYNFKQYFAVVELYHTIKMEYVPETEKDNLKKIYNESLDNFTRQNYSFSFTLSAQKKYNEVLELLLPIQKYNTQYANSAAVLFYIGKTYEDMKNNSKALEYYNMLIDKYPGSDYANWAAYRLKVIG